MAGQSRKWMVLMATVWIQAFTGTNFDFSAYSSELKSVMGISQVQLNYLATASDLGKALGWASGLALLYLPLPAVLLLAATFGAAAYGCQWLLITSRISLPYLPVFLLCLLAGCSICWFNTVCFVLCIQNFPVNRSLALALTISFNGVSAALYTLAGNAINSSSTSIYLLLNAIIPVLASAAALLPILRPPPSSTTSLPPLAASRDTHTFLLLYVLAFFTGLYLLLLHSTSSHPSTARFLLAGAVALLVLPIFIPGIVLARDWACRTIYSSFHYEASGDEIGLRKQLIRGGGDNNNECIAVDEGSSPWCGWDWVIMAKNQITELGEEHGVRQLLGRIDFWLYYIAYLCGATVGLVYSNNLGQVAQSLGRQSQTTLLVTVYSSCSFFGRLLSATPDFLHGKVHFARTGGMAVAMVPMPLAFFLLAEVGGGHALLAGTALIGLSSGFIFAAAVSVTTELFGLSSLGVNHNILITNIPLGSLLYGHLAALVYDANGQSGGSMATLLGGGMVVCMGRQCYDETFWSWGCITLLGLTAGVALYLRTRSAYNQSERTQPMMEQLIHGEAL